MLWDELHKFKLHTLHVNGLKRTPASIPLEQMIQQTSLLLLPLPSILHSSVKHSEASVICANSLIETRLDSDCNKKFFVISSSVKTTQPDRVLRLAGKAYLISTQVDLDEVNIFIVNSS